MTILTEWEPAPQGQVLKPGECRARDGYGQGCVHGVVHLFRLHQSTGLRAWLESTDERALIRGYGAARAEQIEAMETPLFAQFGFAPDRPSGPRSDEGRRHQRQLVDLRVAIDRRGREGRLPFPARVLRAILKS